ncbi:MAG: hypothetical protein FWC15_04900 [Fibromonadales bacterium]|nr:hypothetical protein [Fibromonadales bacterium]
MLKELLFRRFSLLAGLLALASIFVLSYFYYRLYVNSPFVYEQIIANISEYRILDSRFGSAKDNLNIQHALIVSIKEQFYALSSQEIEVPNTNALDEMELSIASRIRCLGEDNCNQDEWNNAQSRAWESSETLLAAFYNLRLMQEYTWSKNLGIFYMLSVLLLLSTLFFAAKK